MSALTTFVAIEETADPRACLGALDVKLTEEETKYLEEPYQPVSIIGHS